MGCIKLSILDEQYQKPEIKVCSPQKELTFDFCVGNTQRHSISTQLITDMYGAVSQAVLYTPFGQIISEYRSDWMLDTIPRFLFSGKILDEESGLNYFEARYQDPKWGGFISRDPLFEKYWWISPYAYCLNNPVIYIDPDGKDIIKIAIANNTWGNTNTPKFGIQITYDTETNTGTFRCILMSNDKAYSISGNFESSKLTDIVASIVSDNKSGSWQLNAENFDFTLRTPTITDFQLDECWQEKGITIPNFFAIRIAKYLLKDEVDSEKMSQLIDFYKKHGGKAEWLREKTGENTFRVSLGSENTELQIKFDYTITKDDKNNTEPIETKLK